MKGTTLIVVAVIAGLAFMVMQGEGGKSGTILPDGTYIKFRVSKANYEDMSRIARDGLAFAENCGDALQYYGFDSRSSYRPTISCEEDENFGSLIMQNLPMDQVLGDHLGDGNWKLYHDISDSTRVWICQNTQYTGDYGSYTAKFDSDRTTVSISLLNYESDNPDLELQCTTGAVACYSDSDCGSDGFSGAAYCSGDNVYRNYMTYTCSNPGTVSSSCSSDSDAQLQQTCTYGCSGGSCLGEPLCWDFTTMVNNLNDKWVSC